MSDTHRAALLIADVQNDFCSGGALAVPDGERVVGPLNRYIGEAVARGVTVYACRDWHPAVTSHFKPFGGPWPPHCIQGSDGARFHPDLQMPPTAIVISKGTDPNAHGYSAFEAQTPDGRPFRADLRERGIDQLYIGGIATDYCVEHSVLDALDAGLQVTVLSDAVAGIDPEASAHALVHMRERGAAIAAGPGLFAGRGTPPAMAIHNTWEHFAHGADIGVRGIGPTKAAAFEQAALALTAVVTDVQAVRPQTAVRIACEAPTDEVLFVDWLNALVYEMAVRRMLFGAFAVQIEGPRLEATAWGEPVDRVRHEPAVEVKGATYTSLGVTRHDDGHWIAQCVVDV